MTAERVGEMRALTLYALAAWRCDPEFDDLVQEGMVRAWECLARHPALPFSTAVVNAARWAACDYKKSRRGGRREPVVSLDALLAQPPPGLRLPVGGDPAGPVLARAERAARWRGLRAACKTEREWQVIQQLFQEGARPREVAAALSISAVRVGQLSRRVLDRYRQAAGIAPPPLPPVPPPADGGRVCKDGHPWVAENLYTSPAGEQSCRRCRREVSRRQRQRRAGGG